MTSGSVAIEASGARALIEDLVAIDSVNPSLIPGAAGEGELARFVAARLTRSGFDVTLQEVAPGRPNVIGRLRGTGGGRSLILNGHLDTVGTAAMNETDVRSEADRVYGRGAFDMKGGIAAILLAAEMLAMAPRLRGDLVVAMVSDEEYASLGAEALVKVVLADAALIAEPTQLEVCIAHKGFAWFEITTTGRAAHGSRPDDGIDAVALAAPILQGICALEGRLAAGPAHPLVGRGSIHVGQIRGGQELSSYPAQCVIGVERRTIPGETTEALIAEMTQVTSVAGERARSELLLAREPYELAADAPVVEVLKRAASTVLGRPVPTTGAFGWMDSAIFAAAGVPTVIFGPGGDGAHSAVEWVSVPDVVACARAIGTTASEFCA